MTVLQARPAAPFPLSPASALGRLDASSVLTGYAVLLMAVPNRLVIGPLGGAGSPAGVLGLACLLWWAAHQLGRSAPTAPAPAPVRTALVALAFAVGASFVAATVRPIDPQEFSTATLGLVLLAGWGGVLLVGNDGIASRKRLVVLVRRVVALSAAMATLGIVQFLTGETLVDKISVPGLAVNHSLTSLTLREGFSRPSATATHPIEYGAVITMMLPLALALAYGDRERSALRRWVPVAAIGICIPLSISRSALVAGAVALVVVLASWPRAARAVAGVALLVGSVLMYLLVPGMLGSLLGLFTRIGSDSSALSRTGSYDIAAEFVATSPVFGRGFGTFLPAYRILDNQYLGLTIEIGLVGLTAFLAVLVAALWSAVRARRAARDLLGAQLATGLLGAVAAGAVNLALFDGLSFSMSAGVLFLVLGLAGACRRLEDRP
ncbi:hypothetical protein FE634_10905 [Nocardioides dongxiaopingii]|uniref:O-antigen ligase family protein n=1 Tax=Nocardioides sp. S-1144 TaxID=2582905 RepID=UPI00110DF4AB|nr:O-antigen ligase family protein [Nocardioides sp. S-1144]QCW50793.1 hypothetical protein FE634_10905 [Nocardioides sp. S-1144]